MTVLPRCIEFEIAFMMAVKFRAEIGWSSSIGRGFVRDSWTVRLHLLRTNRKHSTDSGRIRTGKFFGVLHTTEKQSVANLSQLPLTVPALLMHEPLLPIASGHRLGLFPVSSRLNSANAGS